MLVMTKIISILSDSVDYQKAGPTINFLSVFTHTLCDVRVCYRLMAVDVKAMHTTSTHNILQGSFFSDV